MNSERCYIAGAGDFYSRAFTPNEGDMVVAVDAGYCKVASLGITPDLVVGDFDSLGYVPDHPHIIKHPAVKDDTDMLLAVNEAVKLGCKELFIFGGTGGRLAHTLANLQVLSHIAQLGLSGYMLDEKTIITAIKNGALSFDKSHTGYISVLTAAGNAVGITLTGLKYPLDKATLTPDKPLGVSNEFTGTESRVEVTGGLITVLWQNNSDKLPEREVFSK